MSAFHNFIYRLLLIPINESNFNKEINLIFNIINKKHKKLLLKELYNIDDINTNIYKKNLNILRALPIV